APARATLPPSSGWPRRKAICSGRGVARTICIIVSCSAATVANGRAACARSATQAPCSKMSPSAATKVGRSAVFNAASEIMRAEHVARARWRSRRRAWPRRCRLFGAGRLEELRDFQHLAAQALVGNAEIELEQLARLPL